MIQQTKEEMILHKLPEKFPPAGIQKGQLPGMRRPAQYHKKHLQHVQKSKSRSPEGLK